MSTLRPNPIRPLPPAPDPSRLSSPTPFATSFRPILPQAYTFPKPTRPPLRAAKSHPTHASQSSPPPAATGGGEDDDGGIPACYVRILAKFKSRHNYIRVLEVSRGADHQFAGSRLLLLDSPGNIHSISFLLKFLTTTYFDVFATFPPILYPGPIGILGFGAGSAARLILHLYPDVEIHGWELDSSVISVGREYFGLEKLEKQNPDKLFVHIGDALQAEVGGGFSGVLVDLFSKGSLIPELQDPATWEKLRRRLRRGGRIMVNCGGSCVESEDPGRDGELVMQETLKAMGKVFRHDLLVLNLGRRKEDSTLALTGSLPDLDAWKQALPSPLKGYVDMWSPFNCYGLRSDYMLADLTFSLVNYRKGCHLDLGGILLGRRQEIHGMYFVCIGRSLIIRPIIRSSESHMLPIFGHCYLIHRERGLISGYVALL